MVTMLSKSRRGVDGNEVLYKVTSRPRQVITVAEGVSAEVSPQEQPLRLVHEIMIRSTIRTAVSQHR